MGIQHSSESRGQYLLREGGVGVFVKKLRLVRSEPSSTGHEFYVSSKSHREIHLLSPLPPSCLMSFGLNKREVSLELEWDVR